MKIILLTRKSGPHDPGCYNDTVQVLDDSGIPIYEGSARTWPNPTQPSTGKPCEQAYGAVVPGSYAGKFFARYSTREPFIRCIEIAGGAEIPCMWPNMNHGGRAVVAGVFVHHGQTAEWSGSAACQTIPPADAEKFFGLFADGEEVQIEIQAV